MRTRNADGSSINADKRTKNANGRMFSADGSFINADVRTKNANGRMFSADESFINADGRNRNNDARIMNKNAIFIKLYAIIMRLYASAENADFILRYAVKDSVVEKGLAVLILAQAAKDKHAKFNT